MTKDYAAAIAAAGQLHGAPWFIDRTRESVSAFSGDVEAELAPGEGVSLALAVMIADKSTSHPGLLVVVPGSRFLLCWREESQTFTEYYQLDSVPAATSTAPVPGVEGTADLLILTDRQIVLPSAAVAEHLRTVFTAPTAAPFATEAPDAVQPTTAGPPPDSVADTTPMPAVESSESVPAPLRVPPPPPTATGPPASAVSAAQGRSRSSGRTVLVIVAAAVAGVLLLGGAAYGIYRATQNTAVQSATGGDPAASAPVEEPSEPTPEPSEPESSLPQSSEPLPDDTLVIRRNDSGDWKIETVTVDGSTGSVLASGRQNRAVVLTPDRRTVLYLRVAGETSTLLAVAADGSDGWGLFSDGTSECSKLAQPAISADNVLAVACAGSLNLMSLDGSLIRVLDSGRVGDPTFTRDGRAIIYWKASGGRGGEGGALYRVPVDGSEEPTQLAAADDGPFDDPACSPTEDVVAASQLRGDVRRIVTLSTTPDSPEITPVSPEGIPATGPAWSPDSSRIAYRVGSGDDSSLAVLNADGSSLGEILPAQPHLANPVWTAH